MLHSGGCHCGQVRFEFESDADVQVHCCNCSICQLLGYQHLIIPASSFKLLTEWKKLSLYKFNSGVAKHYFCSACGIKSFYVPRSNPDGYSINFRCVDPSSFSNVSFEDFDGRNWEANAGTLSHLSDEST